MANNQPDPDVDALASAIDLVVQRAAETTGHDFAAEALTPAQQREFREAVNRARGR